MSALKAFLLLFAKLHAFSFKSCSSISGYCDTANLNPQICKATSTTGNITDIDRGAVSYYVDFYVANSIPCIQPSITFQYEQIDIQATDEYISIYNNYGSLIKQCQGNGGSDTQCDVWWTCLNEYSLGITQINAYSTYTIRVFVSYEMDDLCSDSNAVNARLILTCNPTPCPPTFRMCEYILLPYINRDTLILFQFRTDCQSNNDTV